MQKLFAALIVLSLIFPCLADDTIRCPRNAADRNRQCRLAKEKNRQIDETIQNWEPLLGNDNMVMYQIARGQNESARQYVQRVNSMKSFSYRGLNYPLRGKFTKEGTTFIPLTAQEAESVLGRAFQDRQQVARQMRYVRSNTRTLKPMIRNKMTRLQKERRHNTLLLAQCCGYR